MRVEAVQDPCFIWQKGENLIVFNHHKVNVHHSKGKQYVIPTFSWGKVYYSLDDPPEVAISEAMQSEVHLLCIRPDQGMDLAPELLHIHSPMNPRDTGAVLSWSFFKADWSGGT